MSFPSKLVSRYVNIYQNFCARFKKWPSSFATLAMWGQFNKNFHKNSIKIIDYPQKIRKNAKSAKNPQTYVKNFQNPQFCGEICKPGNTGTTYCERRFSLISIQTANIAIINTVFETETTDFRTDVSDSS